MAIAHNAAHRALDDCVTLARIFSVMIDDLPLETVLQLLYSTAAEVPQSMPFGKYQGTPLERVPQDYVLWLAKSGAFEKPENKSLKEGFQKLGIFS